MNINNAQYVVIQNDSGTEFVIDTSDKSYKYKKFSRKFINYTQLMGYTYYKHIILTLSEMYYKENMLNYFVNALRRYYGDACYIWTKEIQMKRFEKTGEAVLHWHMIVAFRVSEFNKEDITRVNKYWKFGSVRVRGIKNLNLKYILKYVGKDLEGFDAVYKGIRKVSMSRIPAFYSQTKKRLFESLHMINYDFDIVKDLGISLKGVFIKWVTDVGEVFKEYVYYYQDRWRVSYYVDDIEVF